MAAVAPLLINCVPPSAAAAATSVAANTCNSPPQTPPLSSPSTPDCPLLQHAVQDTSLPQQIAPLPPEENLLLTLTPDTSPRRACVSQGVRKVSSTSLTASTIPFALTPAQHRPLVASHSSPLAAAHQPFESQQQSLLSSPQQTPKSVFVSCDQKPLLSPVKCKAVIVTASPRSSSPSAHKLFVTSSVQRSISSLTHKSLISPHKSGLISLSNSPALHKPLIAQRSSPTLHRPTLKTPVTTPPKSPLLFSRSSRKLSCPKVTRLSPTQSKNQYQYSKVPKSDSAYSEEPYSYSPVPRGYSPCSDFPYSYSQVPISETQYADTNFPYSSAIPKSDSAYSEQYTNSPFRPRSTVPKSQSTIFRSDSAFSDIEYSYSTIPQSDSCYLDNDYSYSSLPKSDSVYSENVLSCSNTKRQNLIPRSFSSYSHQLVTYDQNDNAEQSSPEEQVPLSPAKPNNSCRRPRSLSQAQGQHGVTPVHCPLVHSSSQSQLPSCSPHHVVPKSRSSYSCSTSPTSLIMPTLKSFLKAPSRSSTTTRPTKYDKNPKKSFISRDTSVHSLRLFGHSTSPEPCIKKSHTVLALSSNLATSGSASTKLLSRDSSRAVVVTAAGHHNHSSNSCSVNNCLSKGLKHSISQTFNQSIGQNLNISSSSGGDASNPQRKKSRRRSQLSAFFPRSFSRSSSIAPSLTSARGSYLGSYIGSNDGEGDTLHCRLCLMDVSVNMMCQLTVCQCRFCKYCMTEYTRGKIQEGEHRIECPDASCDSEGGGAGELTSEEIESLVGRDLLAHRNRLKLSAEVVADPYRVWCPKPGCETIVHLYRPKYSTVSFTDPTSSRAAYLSSDPFSSNTSTSNQPQQPPVKPSGRHTRVRRLGTTVNLYTAPSSAECHDPPSVSPDAEQRLLDASQSKEPTRSVSVVSHNRCSVDSSTSVDVTKLASDDTVKENSCTKLDLINDSVGSSRTSLSNIQIVENEPEVLRSSIFHSDTQTLRKNPPESRKTSLDEVNMIRNIGRPKVLNLIQSDVSEQKLSRGALLAEYPADAALSAAMAALQSPADYRPFAALTVAPVGAPTAAAAPLLRTGASGVQSPADYRPLLGIPEQVQATVEAPAPRWGAAATCPTCRTVFCPACGLESHPGKRCSAQVPVLEQQQQQTGIRHQYKKLLGGPDAYELQGVIKSCPNPKCQVSIERNEGCAQMQCRACKHTFCWYCLASLEEDFLLRHYDKGPCRNKLGHSRASVLCHRLQVLAIFLGVGLLVLAASPLLVFIGPCMLCCKCKNDTPDNAVDDQDA